ncbi:hypothetical protein [Sansalvadorimonas verongulae]|uniref:hypothetical protein n=1 Tax=Sansalvadorimonas verongulae TaxID=2172824 RepID=UPI0012BC4D24|nr:hypothetical protein [Sansalvadorimonas verongulae]MTI12260.1 hypothetical protein [Sansalvadorimonas verongulae]
MSKTLTKCRFEGGKFKAVPGKTFTSQEVQSIADGFAEAYEGRLKALQSEIYKTTNLASEVQKKVEEFSLKVDQMKHGREMSFNTNFEIDNAGAQQDKGYSGY